MHAAKSGNFSVCKPKSCYRQTHKGVRPVIVCLDVIEVARRRECGVIPVQLAQPPRMTDLLAWEQDRIQTERDVQMNGGVSVPNGADVAFEVADIYWVEADLMQPAKFRDVFHSKILETYNCDEQPDIRFSELVTDEVVLAFEHLLEFIKGLEERDDGSLIRLLRLGKPAFVHTICITTTRVVAFGTLQKITACQRPSSYSYTTR